MKKITSRLQNLLLFVTGTPAGHVKNGYSLTYEGKLVRQAELRRIMLDALPRFCLTPDEFNEATTAGEIGEIMRLAISRLSKVRRDKKGDYGELLLFLIVSVYFGANRFVTKIKLRSSRGDQIKGYDCAHFTVDKDGMILWLGEVKFYNSFSKALSDVTDEIKKHTEIGYLKNEFSILKPNIEINKASPDHDSILKLIDDTVSLDDVRIIIPVLLTYDLSKYDKFDTHTDPAFIDEFKKDFDSKFVSIDNKKIALPANIQLLFVLLPLHDVGKLKEELENIEKAWG